MLRWIIALSAIFGFSVCAEQIPVALHFQSGISAEQIIETRVESEIQFPDFLLHKIIEQKLYVDISLIQEDGKSEQLEFVLKRCVSDIRANEEHIRFDSLEPAETVMQAQLQKLLHRPFRFTVLEDLTLLGDENWEHTKEELSAVTENFDLSSFEELASYLFALKNKQVFAGAQYQRNIKVRQEEGLNLEIPINYLINRADLREVQASLSGRVDPSSFSLLGNSNLNIEGALNGQVTWQSQNALFYQLSLQQSYNGTILHEEMRAPLHLKITHRVDSHPKSSLS